MYISYFRTSNFEPSGYKTVTFDQIKKGSMTGTSMAPSTGIFKCTIAGVYKFEAGVVKVHILVSFAYKLLPKTYSNTDRGATRVLPF